MTVSILTRPESRVQRFHLSRPAYRAMSQIGLYYTTRDRVTYTSQDRPMYASQDRSVYTTCGSVDVYHP